MKGPRLLLQWCVLGSCDRRANPVGEATATRSKSKRPLRHAACWWGRSAAVAGSAKAPPQASRRRSRAGGSWGVPRRRGLPQRLVPRHIVQAVAAAALRRVGAARRPLPPSPLLRRFRRSSSCRTRPQTLPLHCARSSLHCVAGRARSLRRGCGVWRHSCAFGDCFEGCPPTPPAPVRVGGVG